MPTPATFQSPPTAIPEPPAFPSLMETQSPDAYFQAGFWDAWGIWIILASILLAVAIAVIVLIRRKGRIPPRRSARRKPLSGTSQCSGTRIPPSGRPPWNFP